MPETTNIFNKISGHYDLLNTIFSFGIDSYWRSRLSGEVADRSLILDIATGTIEVPISILKKNPHAKIIAIDPSINMLRVGLSKLKYQGNINIIQGVNEVLPFKNNTFDAVTIAFGIRNTKDLIKSLNEIKRVLKPYGKLSVLEFTTPESVLFKPLFLFYFNYIMPAIGSLFGSRNESAAEFPQRDKFLGLLNETGFKSVDFSNLTLGIAALYTGVKEN